MLSSLTTSSFDITNNSIHFCYFLNQKAPKNLVNFENKIHFGIKTNILRFFVLVKSEELDTQTNMIIAFPQSVATFVSNNW